MKIKKYLSAAMAAVLAAGAISGCGNKTADGGIKTVHIWSGDMGAKAVFDVLTEEFNKTAGKEKGMKIEWTYLTDNMNDMVTSARKNGTLPEIFDLPYAQRESYIETGDIIAIDDLEGGKEYLQSQEWPQVEGWNIFDGKSYAILPYTTCAGFIYNKDLFKKAGIVDESGEAMPPKTWDEVREYAKKLTSSESGVYGYCFPEKFSWFYTLEVPFASSDNGISHIDTEAGTYTFEGTKPMLDFICGVKEDGSLMPGSESLDNDTARAYFAEGKIGMMPAISWDVGVLTDQFPASCDWGVAPMPIVAGAEDVGVWRDVAGIPVISAKAKEELGDDIIMEAVKFLTSLETRTELYEQGIKIPAIEDVLENASADAEIPPQFREFAELAVNSKYEIKNTPSVKIEGLKASEVFSKVFAGEMTADEAIEDLNTRYTEALKKGLENNDYTLEDFK